MKAMVLAAGLGTRLRPLTDDRPKALVEVGGRTLLEITLLRLKNFGIREVIVNVHHFADKVVAFLATNQNFGMRIEISREDDLLLDTGGGLKKAAWFFLQGDADEPFLLHNVDVVSTIDFERMLRAHERSGAIATLAVQKRESSRVLLFDDSLRLCGRRKGRDQEPELTGNSAANAGVGLFRDSYDFAAISRPNQGRGSFFDHRFLLARCERRGTGWWLPGRRILLARSGKTKRFGTSCAGFRARSFCGLVRARRPSD